MLPRAALYGFLAVAILSSSTGTTWFALLKPTPALVKAHWRMTITALIQTPLMIRELRAMSTETYTRWKTALPLILLTGFDLGLHFSSVATSVDHTSLAHCILLVNVAPLFLVAVAITRYAVSRAMYGPAQFQQLQEDKDSSVSSLSSSSLSNSGSSGAVSKPAPSASTSSSSSSSSSGWRSLLSPARSLPPTLLESVGTILSFAGVALLVSSATDAAGSGSGGSGAGGLVAGESQVTVYGDVVGLLGSATLAAYFAVGARVRKWCPLFSWMCPLHIAASAFTGTCALLFVDGATVSTDGNGLLGWMGDVTRFGYSLGAAVFPGMLGHAISNLVLKHLSALTVSVAMLLQPPIGSVIGYAVGVQGVPSALTAVAAPIILYGAFLVTTGSRDKGLTWRQVLQCKLTPMAPASKERVAAGAAVAAVAVDISGSDAVKGVEGEEGSAADVVAAVPVLVAAEAGDAAAAHSNSESTAFEAEALPTAATRR